MLRTCCAMFQTCDQCDPDGFFVKFAPPAAAFFWAAACTTSSWRDGWWATRDRCGFFASGTIAVHRGLQNPSRNRLEIADATGIRNECTSSFFERFEAAFLAEAIYFVDAVRERQATRRDGKGCIE
jgi:myo-inositol 2-dehydrogenase / D-chiro-inositol 1-dehydrogenase